SANNVSVIGNQGGTFQEARSLRCGIGPRGLIAADLDRDGDLDLVTVNQNLNAVSILENQGELTFKMLKNYPSGASPLALVAADFTGDTSLDLVAGGAEGAWLLEGKGSRTFQNALHLFGDPVISLATTDLDGDLDSDLVVAADSRLLVFLRNGA